MTASWYRGSWFKIDPFNVMTAPALAGVYVLLIDGKVVYVGQSTDLRSRLRSYRIRHGYGRGFHCKWGAYPSADALTIKVKISQRHGDWAMWELRLIHRLRPELNQRMLPKRLRYAEASA
jgi:excinuclease UvrABC nuclease subunit